jgi:predicted enzyme related to lactoylglutathione lyase
MQFNALIPELSVSNISISKSFYLNVLGFVLEYERIEDNFAFISFGNAQIMLEQMNGHWLTGQINYPFGKGINFQIEVDNAQTLRDKIVSNGYALFREIYQVEYKENEIVHLEKEFLVQDPDGYLLRFSETQ